MVMLAVPKYTKPSGIVVYGDPETPAVTPAGSVTYTGGGSSRSQPVFTPEVAEVQAAKAVASRTPTSQALTQAISTRGTISTYRKPEWTTSPIQRLRYEVTKRSPTVTSGIKTVEKLPSQVYRTITTEQSLALGTQAKLRSYGLPGKVTAEFVPITAGQVYLIGATGYAFSKAPTVLKVGGEAYFGYTGIKTAFDPTLPTEKRIAGGIISGLATVGVAAEAEPYLRGGLARLSPKFKRIKTEQVGTTKFERLQFPQKKVKTIKGVDISKVEVYTGTRYQPGKFKVIKKPKDLPFKLKEFDIRIAPPGKIQDFPMKEQAKFLGQKIDTVSGQRDFFGILKKTKPVLDPEGKGMGFFTTPSPKGQPGVVRQSRLSVETFGDLFKIKKGEIGLGVRKPKAQIIFERDVLVTKTGLKPGTVRGIGYSSGELEVTIRPTKLTGELIKGKKTGVTTIYGQAVDIFKITRTPTKSFSKIKSPIIDVKGLSLKSISRTPKTFVSLPGLSSVSVGVSRRFKPTSRPSYRTTRATKRTTYPVSRLKSQITRPTKRTTYPGVSRLSSQITRPTTRPTYPGISRTGYKATTTRPTKIFKQFKTKKYKGKKRKQLISFKAPKFKGTYTPSVSAVILNIKGKKTRGSITGIRLRPLTM